LIDLGREKILLFFFLEIPNDSKVAKPRTEKNFSIAQLQEEFKIGRNRSSKKISTYC